MPRATGIADAARTGARGPRFRGTEPLRASVHGSPLGTSGAHGRHRVSERPTGGRLAESDAELDRKDAAGIFSTVTVDLRFAPPRTFRSSTVRSALCWALVLATFSLLALLRMPEGPRVNEEDYAHYLLHAQAIVEGRSYTDIGFISTPLNPYIGPVAMPPGLPMILAPLVAIGGTDSALIAAVALLSTLAFLTLVGRYFTQREGWPLAMTVALASGLQPDILHFATQALSDLPFCAFVWGVLVLCEREETWSWRRLTALTILGSVAISIRLAGVALIPAITAYGVLHWRTQRWRPLLPLVAWVAVFEFTRAVIPTTTALLPSVGLSSSSMLDVIGSFVRAYGYGIREIFLYPTGHATADKAYHLVALGLAGVGILSASRAYWRTFLGLFAFSYVAMLLLIPVSTSRYLYPLAPIIVFLALRGTIEVLRGVRPLAERATAITAAMAGVVMLLATAATWTRPSPRGFATIPSVQALLHEIERLPPSSEPRVMTFRARIVALETGIPAMALVKGEPAVILRELCRQRISYVVTGAAGTGSDELPFVERMVEAYSTAFEPTYRNADFTLWRFDRRAAQAASHDATCA